MKYLVVGDVHCSVKNIEKVKKLGSFIEQTVAKTPDLDAVIVLGDLHDSFEKAHLQAFNASCDFLLDISAYKKVFYVVGNHDAVSNQIFQTDDHFFKQLKNINKNLIVVDSSCHQKTKDGVVAFVPYVPPGRFWEAIGGARPDLIFCHQEFFGARMGAIESKHGDPIICPQDPSYNPIIVSGHIHDHQRLGGVLYVGAPMHLGFGDKDDKSISLIEFSGGQITEERIYVPLPKKISLSIKIGDHDTLNSVPEETNNEVRLILSGKNEEIAAFKKSNKYKMLQKCYKIVFKPELSENIRKSVKNVGYMDCLKTAVGKEPESVRAVFEEVSRNAFGLK